MPDTRLTDERLRSWLDANQVERERMCIQLLPLLGDYSNIQPRRPKGGRDGSRDLQATYGGETLVWGAVGFRNSARDGKTDKDWVSKKFSSDLGAALAQKEDLPGFVFFTNVDLTPREQDSLKTLARSRGVGHVDIFPRERLRLVLDSVEGWGYRLQFMDIALSKEEQLAFIDKHGARLERLFEQQREELSQQRKEVEARLSRIEFLHDCEKICRGASFFVYLKKPFRPDELGHFRILLEAINLYERDPHPTIWFGARDDYGTWHSKGQKTLVFGVKTLVWSRNPDETIQTTVVGATGLEGQRIDAWGHLYQKGPFRTLGAFDRTNVTVYVTEPLVEKLDYVGFSVNNYLLIGVPKSQIVTSEEIHERKLNRSVEWLEDLSEDERAIPWCALYVRGPDADAPDSPEVPPFLLRRAIPWGINFEEYTPVKMERDTENDDSNTDEARG